MYKVQTRVKMKSPVEEDRKEKKYWSEWSDVIEPEMTKTNRRFIVRQFKNKEEAKEFALVMLKLDEERYQIVEA